MPRLFSALEIPFHVGRSLASLQGGLAGARWVEPENYHITLRFFGDIEPRIADELADSLGRIERKSFDLRLTNLDVFGRKQPRLLYARVEANRELLLLQGEIDRRAKSLKLAKDRVKFLPHISIARVEKVNLAELLFYLTTRTLKPLSFTVHRFVLMSSKTSIGGGPYLVENYWPLGR